MRRGGAGPGFGSGGAAAAAAAARVAGWRRSVVGVEAPSGPVAPARPPARGLRGKFRRVPVTRPPRPESPRSSFPVPLPLARSRRGGRELRGGRGVPGRDRPSGRAAGRPGRREIRLCPADAGDGCRAPPGGRFYIVRPFRVPRGTRFGRVARAGLPAGRRRWRDRAGGAGASAPDLRARGCTCRTSRGVWPPARVDQHARAAAVTDGRTDGRTDRPTDRRNERPDRSRGNA